jgi:hypothetical protein
MRCVASFSLLWKLWSESRLANLPSIARSEYVESAGSRPMVDFGGVGFPSSRATDWARQFFSVNELKAGDHGQAWQVATLGTCPGLAAVALPSPEHAGGSMQR